MRESKSGTLFRIPALMAILSVLAFAIAGAAWTSSAAADNTPQLKEQKHCNIVFVNDVSGSMKSTDPHGLRYQALGGFLALASDSGNKIGSLAFTDKIVATQKLANYNGMAAKRAFLQNLQNTPVGGYTNIGLGIQSAIDMLNSGKDPSLPSVIVLMSDGNTQVNDSASGSDQDAALQGEARAVEQTKADGYGIYTISLNDKDSGYPANSAELAQIAAGTGGKFSEVSTAADLAKTYNLFYSMLFPSGLDDQNQSLTRTFPDSGHLTGNFNVPAIGIAEANMVLNGPVSDIVLTSPNGQKLDKNSLAPSTFASGDYTVIKTSKPQGGQWAYDITGTPGTKLEISFIDNANLSAGMSVTPSQHVYKDTDKIQVAAFLLDDGKKVDAAHYNGFAAKLSLMDYNKKVREFGMRNDGDKFSYALPALSKGTYIVHATITGQGFTLNSSTTTLNINSTPPVKKADLDVNMTLWPQWMPVISNGNTRRIALADAVSDSHHKPLKYAIQSTSFGADAYRLNGGTVTVFGNKLLSNPFALPQGSFTIRATNEYGSYVDFNVKVTTTNAGLLATIAVVAGVLIVLCLIGLTTFLATRRRFSGTVSVAPYDETTYAAREWVDLPRNGNGRGSRRLSMFHIDGLDINTRNVRFQATGKPQVIMINKGENLYRNGKRVGKKTVITSGKEITFKTGADAKTGFIVKFNSLLRKKRRR